MVADQPADRLAHVAPAGSLPVAGPDDLARARRFVAESAAVVGLGAERIEQFQIALSEVVTSALTHADGLATVTVGRDGTAVTVEVRDRGPGMTTLPSAVLPPPTQLSGRGLAGAAAV